MKKYTHFDLIKADRKLIDRFEDIIHTPSSYDNYSLVKQKKWNILYIEPKDFHQKIDDEIKIFFKKFFKKYIYLLDLPLSKTEDLSELQLLQVKTYEDFISLWSYYSDSKLIEGEYKECSNFEGLLRSFFIASNLAIFDESLDWIFYNDVDYHISALLYSNDIKNPVEGILQDYKGIMSLEEIREDIPNFATKKW